MRGVVVLLSEWYLWKYVVGGVYDTTKSNTDCHQGSVTLIKKEKGVLLLKMPCRRHVHELHAKHVAHAVSGQATTSPGDTLFLAFYGIWDDLMTDGINYENLVKFDWRPYLGTVVELQAHKVLMWAKQALASETFHRSD